MRFVLCSLAVCTVKRRGRITNLLPRCVTEGVGGSLRLRALLTGACRTHLRRDRGRRQQLALGREAGLGCQLRAAHSHPQRTGHPVAGTCPCAYAQACPLARGSGRLDRRSVAAVRTSVRKSGSLRTVANRQVEHRAGGLPGRRGRTTRARPATTRATTQIGDTKSGRERRFDGPGRPFRPASIAA